MKRLRGWVRRGMGNESGVLDNGERRVVMVL